MALRLSMDVSFAARRPWTPGRPKFMRWALGALADKGMPPGSGTGLRLSLRVVGVTQSRSLNARYRTKDKATNVLSFAGAGTLPDGSVDLGELVICAPVVAREASRQAKKLEAHWAHLTVHGVLHLLGFDHERRAEARVMEAAEIQVLDRLGYPNPYVGPEA